MVRHQQANIDQRMPDLVNVTGGRQTAGQAIVFAQVLQLIDQVKKEKQRQKAQRNQRDGCQHLTVNQAANRFHAAALMGFKRERKAERSVQLALRLANHSRPRANTPPCSNSSKPPKLIDPPKIQLCPRLTRLL